ncbi:universal stress protein [Lacinutrix sp. C3R15]|uniref:universal stress protein n=1 Tax=Flavobacteriaceae TaxID=49546 RepID=UPI001C081C0B|nr:MULTISPECIES: universal stress protein [Flavobacteriaceae]MBU2939977.1 universal stress protein [Lacinutrix sp. C3R15]MDO6623294.1 universal stress protein [Oceanihabitans sp. 1_MG-2023]
MKNILVTIDFRSSEQLLVAKAFELAEKFDSKIWLIHIAAPDPDFVGLGVGPQNIRDSRATELRKEHQQLQEYTDTLKNKGIAAEGLLVQGATIEMIMEKAKKLQIDLIIAGHQEHNFLYNAFIGSVSREIVKKSKIPVLIVPLD